MKKGQTLKGELEKIHGGPKQYQQGYTEFYRLKFLLTPDVLIPRPETELLVDEVLGIYRDRHASLAMTSLHSKTRVTEGSLRDHEVAKQSLTIVDLGTGSGCIAISIAKNLPQAKIIATDISSKALEVAKKNAKFHKVEDKILFLESDLLNFLNAGPLDIIIANLPYIPAARLMLVDPLVRDFEPKIALDGGRDGFEVYRRLFTQISQQPSRLQPKYLVVEIDEEQGEIALAEAKKHFPSASFEIKKDLARKDRILIVNFTKNDPGNQFPGSK